MRNRKLKMLVKDTTILSPGNGIGACVPIYHVCLLCSSHEREDCMISAAKKIREQRGLTRREVAIAVGLTEQTVYNFEEDPEKAITRNIVKIADYYGVTTDELLGREGK